MNLAGRIRRLEQATEDEQVEVIIALVRERWARQQGAGFPEDHLASMRSDARDLLHGGPIAQSWARIEAEPTLELRAAAFLREFPHDGLSIADVARIFSEDVAEKAAREQQEASAMPKSVERRIEDLERQAPPSEPWRPVEVIVRGLDDATPAEVEDELEPEPEEEDAEWTL